jgi:hypothetical protein
LAERGEGVCWVGLLFVWQKQIKAEKQHSKCKGGKDLTPTDEEIDGNTEMSTTADPVPVSAGTPAAAHVVTEAQPVQNSESDVASTRLSTSYSQTHWLRSELNVLEEIPSRTSSLMGLILWRGWIVRGARLVNFSTR